MKSFIKVLWTIFKVGLFVIGGMVILGMVLAIVIALCSSGDRKLADKSVLIFNLDTKITDRPTDKSGDILNKILDSDHPTIQLRAATLALRDAAKDKHISALYLHGNLQTGGYSSGYASLKELREAIQDFQKSGKPVIAYIADADNRDYYLESVADQILLNPVGLLAFRGLAANGVFLKGAADKYGLEFTPIRHGKYKSAIEPLTRQDFSPENREQIDALLKVVWGEMLNSVAASRKIPSDKLQALVDKEGLISAEIAKDQGLVTELAYEGQALDKLRVLAGKSTTDKSFPQISIAQYAADHEKSDLFKTGKDKIAILYAEGEIIGGNASADGEVAGDRFARIIRGLRQRKDIKAVVLRVNSPGGSGQASEVMLEELRRFNSDKPVVVSMGTVAASGGYYISMASRRIFAEPNTITGSIGVFGLTLNAQKIANDHGITFDSVKTGAMADLGTIARPMTADEQGVIQHLVDHFYDEFIQRVATGRKLTTNRVDEIAQGRVWSGADALKIGLVDELGGLQLAITDAAKEARLGADYSVVEYPAKKPFLTELSESLHRNEQPLAQAPFTGRVMQVMMQEWRLLSSFNDPHGIYTRMPFDVDLN